MYYYYHFLIRPFHFSKFFSNFFFDQKPFIIFLHLLKQSPNFLEKCVIEIFLKNIKEKNDSSVFRSYLLLQAITEQTPHVTFYTLLEKKKTISCAKLLVTLNSFNLYKFIYFFLTKFPQYLEKKNKQIINSYSSKNSEIFGFFLDDVSIFDFLPSEYYAWNVNISFKFYFSSFSLFNKNSSISLKTYNIPVKDNFS